MSRTIRHNQFSDKYHQGKVQKLGGHKPMRHDVSLKLSVGPGGINCPCCTRLRPTKLNRATIKRERRRIAQLIRSAEE